MSATVESVFLRKVLLSDGLGALAAAPLLLFGADALSPWLGLPPALLSVVGAVLALLGMAILWLARAERMPRWAVWAVIAVNACWVVDSVVLLMIVSPTQLGIAVVLAQAAVVAVIAELEFIGLRRMPAFAA